MNLSGLNLNKCEKILRAKAQALKEEKALNNTNILPDTTPENHVINEYGEVEVKLIHQKQKHLSNGEIQEIIQKYQSGETLVEIAMQYNCHRQTVSSALKTSQPYYEEDPLLKFFTYAKIIINSD